MNEPNIRMITDSCKYTLRASALIIRDGHLLTAHYGDQKCCYTVGGGVQLGESSLEAVKREMREELGCELSIVRLLYVQERFYSFQGLKHHETVFFYLVDGSECKAVDGVHTDQALETLHWISMNELKHTDIVPHFLRDGLDELPLQPVHLISYE